VNSLRSTCSAIKLNNYLRLKVLQYAQSVGMKVVGYYQACERLDDTALAPIGEKVASKIRAQFEDAIAFVVCQIH
jgi:Uncharacterised protein family (UPF0172)